MANGRDTPTREDRALAATAQRALATRRSRKKEPPERLLGVTPWGGTLAGKPNTIRPVALRPVEQNLIVLMQAPGEWLVVDELPRGSANSGMRVALWRRGAEVIVRTDPMQPDVAYVWARWPHPVPKEVAPWEM